MISSRALTLLSAGLLLASATAASAQTVQDRYGPPPAANLGGPSPAGESAYGGQVLSWAGKRSAAPTMAQAAPNARPEPLALARQFDPQAAPVVRAPAPVQPGYEPVLRAPLAPVADPASGLMGGPPAGSLPTSIYGQAAPAPPAPAQSFAQASVAPRAGGSQLYSLHREYGMTPDAIPAPPAGDNYILVGPPDSPAAPVDDEDPAQGLDRQF